MSWRKFNFKFKSFHDHDTGFYWSSENALHEWHLSLNGNATYHRCALKMLSFKCEFSLTVTMKRVPQLNTPLQAKKKTKQTKTSFHLRITILRKFVRKLFLDWSIDNKWCTCTKREPSTFQQLDSVIFRDLNLILRVKQQFPEWQQEIPWFLNISTLQSTQNGNLHSWSMRNKNKTVNKILKYRHSSPRFCK